jgi:two-component system, OmpR family, response regulator
VKSRLIVLLVDDDAIILECVTAFLEDEGFSVHTAMSAEDALGTIELIQPVVCITDLWLPGMNGEEFILQARQLSPKSHFMIHTGSDYLLPAALRAIGMNAHDVLLKPVHELSLLSERIRRIAGIGRP